MSAKRFKKSIVRIYSVNGDITGAGFFVTDRHIVTCAHVVSYAFGFSENPPSLPEDDLQIDFPLISTKQSLSASVCHWCPSIDVAGLEIAEDLSVEIDPLSLVVAEEVWRHPIRVFGFPTHYEQGVWVSGVLRDNLANNWLQMEDPTTPGYNVAPGFSGSPVWDEVLEGVIGIIVAAEADEQVKSAYLIPADSLISAWPTVVRADRHIVGSGKEDITCIVRRYFLENPLFTDRDILTILDQELQDGSLVGFQLDQNTTTATEFLVEMSKIFSETPESISELEIIGIEKDVLLRASLRVQMEEQYFSKAIVKPTPKQRQKVIQEMHDYSLDQDFSVVPISQDRNWEQAVPGTYEEIDCTHCGGTGHKKNTCNRCQGTGKVAGKSGRSLACRACSGKGYKSKKCLHCHLGKIGVYKKHTKRVYSEVFALFTSGAAPPYPSKNLDILWKSPIQEEPFDEAPFHYSDLDEETTSEVESKFKQIIREIQIKAETNQIKPKKADPLADMAQNLLGVDTIRSILGIDLSPIRPEKPFVSANLFQVLVEATPIYRIRYKRQEEYTKGFWFWKKKFRRVLRGKVHFNGSSAPNCFSYSECEINNVELGKV